jgi:acyl carrier protein
MYTVKEELIKITSNIFQIKESEVAFLVKDGIQWDSIKNIELITSIEMFFNIEFREEEIIQVNRFEQIIELVLIKVENA